MPTKPLRPQNNVPLPLQERLAQQSKTMMTPMSCPECGSTWFMDMHAAQYNNGGYGSVQYRLLTVTPVPVKVCLCGKVFAPAPTAGKAQLGSEPSFQAAVQDAEAHRKSLAMPATAVASKREFDKLAAMVESIRQVVPPPPAVDDLPATAHPAAEAMAPPEPDLGSLRPARRRRGQ